MAGIRAGIAILLLVSLPEQQRRSSRAQPLPGGGPAVVLVVFRDRLLELQVHRV